MPMNYCDWEQTMPTEIKGDSVWKLLTMIPIQRGQLLREDALTYDVPLAVFEFESIEQLDNLLEIVPKP